MMKPTYEELENQNKRYIRALQFVWENDKTQYDYHGKARLNRNGVKPDEGRFKTPCEIAYDTLSDVAGIRPHSVVDGERVWK